MWKKKQQRNASRRNLDKSWKRLPGLYTKTKIIFWLIERELDSRRWHGLIWHPRTSRLARKQQKNSSGPNESRLFSPFVTRHSGHCPSWFHPWAILLPSIGRLRAPRPSMMRAVACWRRRRKKPSDDKEETSAPRKTPSGTLPEPEAKKREFNLVNNSA